VGDRATPGLLRALVAALRREKAVLVRLRPAISGQLAALRDLALGRRLEVLEIAPS
jgi:hypothetical protein